MSGLADRKLGGFTLVEVLVAVLIFAIGLIGVVSLQVFGLKSAASASNLRAATLHLNELAEMMRLHAPEDALDYTEAVTCPSTTDQVEKDLCGIRDKLGAELGLPPDGLTLSVSHNAADDVYTVQATWDARVAFWSDVTESSASLSFQL